LHSKKDLERISQMFDSYIKRVLKNYRMDYIRRNRKKWENESFLEDLSFEKRENLMKTVGEIDTKDVYLIDGKAYSDEMIHEKVNSLPEKNAVVVTLHYFDEVSDERIAEILGISRRGVNKRRRTGLKLLREMFEETDDEEE